MFLNILLLIVTITFIYLYFKEKKDKEYYKNIIDSSANIVVIAKKDGLVNSVNKKFFKYFDKYKSLEEFIEKNGSIDQYFVEENGYLKKEMDGQKWLEYLIEHNNADNKVKMLIDGDEHYFTIGASKVKDKDEYSIVLASITDEEKYKKKLEELTITDPLTGIKNRRYFIDALEAEIERAKRYNHNLSLIMFDIDHFKLVNDQHGHDVGDEVLKEYTKLISSELRKNDAFCRIGGEEFIVILPHVKLSFAVMVAEKLRESVEEYKKVLPITMSFGVVEYRSGEDKDELFKRVDNALYEAKENGRNRVVAG
jgi:diguanylate cyclase (GGDEF)-like protein